MMRYFYLSLILSFCCLCRAQNTVNLLSSNGALFKVYRNDRVINKTPQASVVLEKIMNDTLYLKVEFENTAKYGLTLYLLEKGMPVSNKEFSYRISAAKHKLELVFMDIYPLTELPGPLVPQKQQPADAGNYGSFGHFCEMENGMPVYYNNLPANGNCIQAMPDTFLSDAVILIKKMYKQNAVYSIVENTGKNNCLSVAQFSTLLGYVNDELDKLQLIKAAYYHLTDAQNAPSLEKSFRLDVSRRELAIFLSHAGDPALRLAASCTSASPEEEIRKLADNVSAFMGDGQRVEFLRKVYGNYCFSLNEVLLLLQKFVHDREKTEAAKLLYFKCTEKENFMKVADTFSYPQYTKELQSFVDKQAK